MNSNNPIISDGNVYDKLSLNLAATSFYKNDGSMDMSVALRIIPTRVDNEAGGITLDNQAYATYRGSLSELRDVAETNAINKILEGLQELINSRGW